MIQGFEEQTQPLSDYEKGTLLPIFSKCLRNKIGKSAEVTNKFIVEQMRKFGYKVNDVRVRKIINYIRVNDIVPCLVASTTGYYVATTEQELIEYEFSLLNRENAISEVRYAIERQRLQTFGKA